MEKEITAFNSKRLIWADALKGYAMLFVLMVHTGAELDLPQLLLGIVRAGWCGVVLFFLISVFLSYNSLSFYFKKNQYSFVSCLKWIKNRFCFLIPLFYVAVCVGFFYEKQSIWLGSETNITISNFLTHLFFVHGFFPRYSNSILYVEWFVGVLAIFTLLIPFLFKYVNSVFKALFLFALSSPVVYYLNEFLFRLKPFSDSLDEKVYNSYISDFCFIEHFPTLILGIFLYYIFQKINLSKVPGKQIISYFLLIVCFELMCFNFYDTYNLFLINKHTVWALIFSLLIVSQMLVQNQFLCNKFVQIVGRYSWGIYLFQFYLIDIYADNLNFNFQIPVLDWIAELGFVLGVGLLFSIVVIHLFNKPIVNFLTKK